MVNENCVWRIRTNQELTSLYKEPVITLKIRIERLSWLGHVERMSEERTLKKVFKNTPEEKRSVRMPSKQWVDGLENDLKKMGVRGWRKVARDTDSWKWILKDGTVLHGPQRQWRDRESAHCTSYLPGRNGS